MRIGNYHTQIIGRLKWIFNIDNMQENPCPSWYYPATGWCYYAKEIEKAIRLDDELTLSKKESHEHQ